MFPYVCLATMPLFCNQDWPRRLGSFFKRNCATLLFTRNQDATNNGKFSKSQPNDMYEDHIFNDETSNKKISKNSNDEANNQIDNKLLINARKRKGAIEPMKTPSLFKDIRVDNIKSSKTTKRQKFVASLLLCHVFLQCFLPYSHFITKVP